MNTVSSSTPSGQSEALLGLVDEIVLELHPGTRRRARLDSRLDHDLGLDSLARMELLARVEKTYGVTLPSDVQEAAETPRALLDALRRAVDTHPGSPAPEPVSVVPASPAASGSPDAVDTLVDLLQWHAERNRNRVHVSFLIDGKESGKLTYAQLRDGAATIGEILGRLGVLPGQRVAIMLPSGPDFLRCFFGVLWVGAIPVPLYPPARPAQIEAHVRRQARILENCQAVALIAFEQVRSIAKVLTGLVADLRILTTPEELQSNGRACAATASAADATALIQYTSGSTGDPKGVTLTHANLLANIRAWGETARLTSDDLCVSWLPLYHDMGLIGTWLGSLYHACPLVLMSPVDFLVRPERWLRAVATYGGTVTAAPNFAFDLCVKRLAGESLTGLDLSSWRLAANGAEPVSPLTIARFCQTFGKYGLRPEALTPVYGLAECSVGLAVPPPGRGVKLDRVDRETLMEKGCAVPIRPEADDAQRTQAFVSCGRPLPAHAVRVVDEAGAEVPERNVGNLEFRGPSATRGYFRNPEATRALFHGDWLVSGDQAYIADGEIYIVGRSKDIIIRGGRNFHPYELEQAVGEIAGIRKGCVAVFGTADDSGSESLVVVAETAERDPRKREALERRISGLSVDLLDLPPDDVVLAPPHSVLKTSSGKIRRTAVRDAYARGTLASPAAPPWRQMLGLFVSGATGRIRKHVGAAGAYLYGAWVWGWFLALFVVALLGIFVLPSGRLRWALSRRLARLLALLCGYAIEVRGLENRPGRDCVMVANHASYIDGFLLIAALPDPVRFIAKAEFKKTPLIRWLLGRLGARFVDRSAMRRSVDDAERLSADAHGPMPLLFFAEGTFSSQPGLKAFRLGAFKIAAECAFPIVPVTLTGTREVLRDGSWLPRRGRLGVRLDEAVHPAGNDWGDVLALRHAVRHTILKHCGERDVDDV